MPLTNKQQYICPSVICFDFLHLSQQYEILKKNNVNFLHIDVMDGSFVNQITIGSDFIKQTKTDTLFVLATHSALHRPTEQSFEITM